jgi:uncharacterized protein (DUF1778 family)
MAVKRRKPKAQRREDLIQLRVTAEDKQAFADAAAKEGRSLSSWVVWHCREVVKRAKGDPGKNDS